MQNCDIEWLHDKELPEAPPGETRAEKEQRVKDAQELMVVVTARCRSTGVTIVGRSVRRLGSEYWRERNRLHDELVRRLTQAG